MRIRGFDCNNWLGHAHLAMSFSPLTIIAGGNDVGKTSVADGLSYAMLGGLPRVTQKSDRAMLIRDGADNGSVTIHAGSDWSVTRNLKTGKIAQSGQHPQTQSPLDPSALPFVFDPAKFASASQEERRVLLLALTKVAVTRDAVVAKLTERKHRADLIEKLPDATIADMTDFAREQAAQARGAWRAVTGKTYGDKIGGEWIAERPDPLGDQEECYQLYQENLARANHARGVLAAYDAGIAQESANAARVATMRRLAANLQTHRDTLAAIEAEALPDLAAAEAAAAELDGATDTSLSCPDCGSVLVLIEGELRHHTVSAVLPSAEEQKKIRTLLASVRQVHDSWKDRHDRVSTLIRESEANASALEAMGLPVEDPAAGSEAKESGRPALAAATAAAVVAEVNSLRQWEASRDIAQEIDNAQKATVRASEAHREVQDWAAIAVALAPNGIPGELLESALRPVNDALRDLAIRFAWPQAAIRPDMEITSDGRLYQLVSESRQWRTDAMLAIVLARLSGVGFVLLDRFDVLETSARKPALAALYRLTKSGELDTAVVLGTLKAKPVVPPDVLVHWLGAEPAAA